MNPFAIACLVLSGIKGCVGAFHLVLYLKWRGIREHLPFALMCLGLAAYDVFSAGLYSSGSVQEGVAWQRLQLLSVGGSAVANIWFLSLLAHGRVDRPSRVFSAAIGTLTVVASASSHPALAPSAQRPAIKEISLAGRHVVTYYESQPGALFSVGIVVSYLAFTYLLVKLYRTYQRDPSGHLLAIILGQGAFLAGLVNDGLVTERAYSFIYISEYTYLVMVGAMAYALLSRFVDAHRLVADFNRRLEGRVEEALAHIKTLRGLIPICSNCKKVRDDTGYWSEVEAYVGRHSDATFSHGICPDCIEKLYPEYAARLRARPAPQ